MKTFFSLAVLTITSISSAQPTRLYADSVRKASHIPELAYAVVKAGTVPEMQTTGYHSVQPDDTATLNDRFHIGSNTKAMTAFMIAKYVETGKLTWTTKFFSLFPRWRSSSRKEYYNITLQDLLSHRAFIQPYQGFDDPEIPPFKGSIRQKREQFGKFVLTLEPAKKDSGQTYVYSNAGYTLAALMLEKVTGKSWEQLVDKVFNKDLHLQVQLSWPDNQKRKDTWGHITTDDKLVPVPSDTSFRLDYTEPSSNINIRLADYIRYIQLNLQGLAGKNNYLKASTYQYIHTGIADYSLGWFNITENGKGWSTHSGTAFTYYAIAQLDRQRGIAYIVFTNCYNQETQIGVRNLLRKLKATYQ